MTDKKQRRVSISDAPKVAPKKGRVSTDIFGALDLAERQGRAAKGKASEAISAAAAKRTPKASTASPKVAELPPAPKKAAQRPAVPKKAAKVVNGKGISSGDTPPGKKRKEVGKVGEVDIHEPPTPRVSPNTSESDSGSSDENSDEGSSDSSTASTTGTKRASSSSNPVVYVDQKQYSRFSEHKLNGSEKYDTIEEYEKAFPGFLDLHKAKDKEAELLVLKRWVKENSKAYDIFEMRKTKKEGYTSFFEQMKDAAKVVPAMNSTMATEWIRGITVDGGSARQILNNTVRTWTQIVDVDCTNIHLLSKLLKYLPQVKDDKGKTITIEDITTEIEDSFVETICHKTMLNIGGDLVTTGWSNAGNYHYYYYKIIIIIIIGTNDNYHYYQYKLMITTITIIITT
jgi:hypothetical protein